MTQDEMLALMTKMQARIATLEEEKSTAKKAPQGPDVAKLRQLMTMDPNAAYKALGLSADAINHIRTVAVAETLGDQAPLPMKMAAMQGSSIVAAQAQSETLAELSRQLEEMKKERAAEKAQTAFKSTLTDASKYPHLAKMLKAKPDRFDAELAAYGGSISDFAKSKEDDLVLLLGEAPQESPAGETPTTPASVQDAGIADPSKKVVSAPLANSLNAVPAPGAANGQKEEGKWDKATYEATKQRILAQK